MTDFDKVSKEMVGYTPKHSNVDLETIKHRCNHHFPNSWQTVEVCMSVMANLCMKNHSGCIGVNLIGPPSGQKTTILSLFYDLATNNLAYKTDNFTPRAFVTHASTIARDDLKKIDLLPRIVNKCVIVPELAPIFGKRKEDLVENVSILTRVFDGEGYESDSGIRGKRGYRGDYFFTWLGATTPPKYRVWETMSSMGARWFFINVGDINNDTDNIANLVCGSVSYPEKIQEIRPYMTAFFGKLINKYGLRKIVWNTANDDVTAVKRIVELAKLLAKLRGSVQAWRGTDDQMLYQTPLIEEPLRASDLLLQVARGRALIHGRANITLDDVPMIRRIVLSSCQPGRSRLINLLLSQDGIVDCKLVANAFNCSDRHARTLMNIFHILKIGTYAQFDVEFGGVGRPHSVLTLRDEYKNVLLNSHSGELSSETISEVKKTTV